MNNSLALDDTVAVVLEVQVFGCKSICLNAPMIDVSVAIHQCTFNINRFIIIDQVW